MCIALLLTAFNFSIVSAEAKIETVKIYNKVDCCSERLKHFDVKVSDDGVNWTIAHYQASPVGNSLIISLGSIEIQFIRIQLRGTDFLSLREVEVMGEIA